MHVTIVTVRQLTFDGIRIPGRLVELRTRHASKAVPRHVILGVFEPSRNSRSFTIVRSGVPPDPDSPIKQMYPVFEFINQQMRNMLNFIDVDLLRAVTAYANEYSLKRQALGIPHSGRMQSPGTGLYRLVNHIEVPPVVHSARTPDSGANVQQNSLKT